MEPRYVLLKARNRLNHRLTWPLPQEYSSLSREAPGLMTLFDTLIRFEAIYAFEDAQERPKFDFIAA